MFISLIFPCRHCIFCIHVLLGSEHQLGHIAGQGFRKREHKLCGQQPSHEGHEHYLLINIVYLHHLVKTGDVISQ